MLTECQLLLQRVCINPLVFPQEMIQCSKSVAYNTIRMCQRETKFSGNRERPESQEAASENLRYISEVKQVIGINLPEG